METCGGALSIGFSQASSSTVSTKGAQVKVQCTLARSLTFMRGGSGSLCGSSP